MVLSWGADRGGRDYKDWICPLNVSDFGPNTVLVCLCCPVHHSKLTSRKEQEVRSVRINMTDTEKKRDAPVLIAVDHVSVTQWVKSYEAYVKRGGTRHLRDCIDADVLETLSLLGIEVASSGEDLAADDDRFLKELRAVHAAPDEDSARAALSAISLTGGFTVDAVCSFVLAYTKAVTQHAKAVGKLGDEAVLDIFLDGVEPKLMRKRLKGGSPATWKAAAKDLVRRVREYEVKVKEVELLEKALRAEKKTNAKVKASVPVGGAELPTQLNSTQLRLATRHRAGAVHSPARSPPVGTMVRGTRRRPGEPTASAGGAARWAISLRTAP